VNGDGKLDLIVANCGPAGNANCPGAANGNIGILLGNGDGTFQPVSTFDAGGFGPWSVATGDLNGDGKVDVIVANRGTTDSLGSVGVLLGNGDGTFRPVVTYPAYEPVSVAVADLNKDGKADVAVTYLDAGQVAVMLGNGNGTLGLPVVQSSGGQLAWGLAVGDVNNDGKPDLVVANACQIGGCSLGGAAAVLLGRGNGTFRPAIAYSTGAGGAVKLAIADVDGDGKPDLVVANENSGSNTGSVGLLLGNGNGTFQVALNYPSGGAVNTSVAAADLNGDGRMDVVATNLCMAHTHSCGVGGGVGVLLKATFATQTLLTTSGSPSVVGQPVTFDAKVTSLAGTVPDGEVVNFYDNGVLVGSAPLSSTTATFTMSFLKAKNHFIKTLYAGDPSFRKSSATITQVVQP
jgi:hypothetical protein